MTKYKTAMMALDSLKPYPANAKKHPQEQIDALAREISDVGFRVPIVVDSDLVIVQGHGRLQAARQAGLTEVPVHTLPSDISPERVRAMRLFDNKIGETGWDTMLLNQELVELSEIPDFDISLTGFDVPTFEPDLPDDEDNPDEPVKLEIRVMFETEDEQQSLFVELRDRGFKVKA